MALKILSEKNLQILEKELSPEEIEKSLNKKELSQYIYSKGYWDIEYFSDYFLSHRKQKFIHETRELAWVDTPDFHKEIRNALDSGEDINVVIARGHGKTTAILIRIMHTLLYKKLDSIIYLASAGLGEEGIGKIRYELETNQEIIAIFGNMVPNSAENKIDKSNKKWRQKLLQLTNGTSVETISMKGAVRGRRPKKIIADDPQENKDVKNKKIVEAFNEWVFSALYNTLLPGGSMCVLGTVIGNLCLVKHLKDVKQWKTIQYEGCDESMGNILWPEMWSKEELIKRKRKIGSTLFNQEFRNIPVSQENALIKPEWIRYYKGTASSWERIVMAIDPARKEKESSDFTGITVVGIKNKKKYVLFSTQVKLSPLKNYDYIYNLYLRFNPNKIIYEDNVEEMLYQTLRQKGLPIQTVHASTDKYTRLLQVAPQIEFGEVFFRIQKDDDLIDQLTLYPNAEHDDIMDSLVYCLLDDAQTINNDIHIINT